MEAKLPTNNNTSRNGSHGLWEEYKFVLVINNMLLEKGQNMTKHLKTFSTLAL